MTILSRRALVLGGGAALTLSAGGLAAVETGLLPGKVGVDRVLGQGRLTVRDPAGPTGAVRVATFHSQARGRDVSWALLTPPGHAVTGLPVALVLHGRGGSALSVRDVLHAHRYLGAHVRAGRPPLALVSVDGDDRYWHPRAATKNRPADDALAMITDELLPRVGSLGARVDQIATMGYSMGGYGSLLLARESEAGRLNGVRVAAAAASSPALFPTWASSSSVAFDGPPDWRRWGDLVHHPDVRRTPLTVSCGTTDPFAASTRAYRRRCPVTPAGGLSAGRHDGAYWRSLLPAQLAFVAEHLSA